jgi:hypothetical protein
MNIAEILEQVQHQRTLMSEIERLDDRLDSRLILASRERFSERVHEQIDKLNIMAQQTPVIKGSMIDRLLMSGIINLPRKGVFEEVLMSFITLDVPLRINIQKYGLIYLKLIESQYNIIYYDDFLTRASTITVPIIKGSFDEYIYGPAEVFIHDLVKRESPLLQVLGLEKNEWVTDKNFKDFIEVYEDTEKTRKQLKHSKEQAEKAVMLFFTKIVEIVINQANSQIPSKEEVRLYRKKPESDKP